MYCIYRDMYSIWSLFKLNGGFSTKYLESTKEEEKPIGKSPIILEIKEAQVV